VKKLLAGGFRPHRTIHLSFVPDEEIGGEDGMSVMLKSKWYESIDVAIALDEGLASEDDQYSVFYGERLPWWIKMSSKGNTGHASRFIEDTAISSIIQVVNNALSFREEQRQKLHNGAAHDHACSHSVARKTTLGDVTSLNVTVLKAGVEAGGRDVLNVIPATAEAGFDIRISPNQPTEEVEALLNKWCAEVNKTKKETGDDGKVTWCHYNPALKSHSTTDCSDENPWWYLFRSTIYDKFNITLRPGVFPAATDSRFLRHLGVKAFGFSPMRNCPILLHENDEYIPESTFLEGIEVYCDVIAALSSDKDIE
jgi:aminoacylase